MAKRFWRAAGAVAIAGLSLGGVALSGVAGAQTFVDLGQGWGQAQHDIWYGVSQGSRLLPYAWFAALEAPAGGTGFLDDAYFGKFHYLPIRADTAGRRLPPGFVIDQTGDERLTRTKLPGLPSGTPWVGMNCSACHTAQITYSNKGTQAPVTLRAEGGPTGADFQSFIDELNQALTLTLNQPDRFDRFAAKVGGDRETLKTALTLLVARQTQTATQNQLPGGYHYGYGRLDAIGNIYNKVVIAASANPVPSAPQAPVSYPFLWNVPQHDKVQWDGIAPNDRGPLLPLLRNGGEVIGVFGDIELNPPRLPLGYKSSVDARGIMQLESTLGSLKPPHWPNAVLGAPDPALVKDGWHAYRDHHCIDCHAVFPKRGDQEGIDNLYEPIAAKMSPLSAAGTDPWMACNAFARTADTGVLNGTFYGIGTLKKTANVADMLLVTVAGTLLYDGDQIIQGLNKDILDKLRRRQLGGTLPPLTLKALAAPAAKTPPPPTDPSQLKAYCASASSPLLAYKGRPLYGVWATAPYLHNGSVATLWDLMLPPAQRPKAFWTGTREFNPVEVGFVTDPGGDNSFQFNVIDPATGQEIPGNSNLGHDYKNASLSDHDRWAIIAYIKAGLPTDAPP